MPGCHTPAPESPNGNTLRPVGAPIAAGWYRRATAASGRHNGHGNLDVEDFAEALAQSVPHLKTG